MTFGFGLHSLRLESPNWVLLATLLYFCAGAGFECVYMCVHGVCVCVCAVCLFVHAYVCVCVWGGDFVSSNKLYLNKVRGSDHEIQG